MTKAEFIDQLKNMTAGLSGEEADKFIEYYSELIEDAMEEGMTEQEAVASLGTMEDIADYIKENNNAVNTQSFPAVTQYAPKPQPRKMLPVWAIVLIIIGFPIWFSLLCAAFSVYISVWAVILSLFASALAMGVGGIGMAVAAFFTGDFGMLMVVLGAGLLLIGIGILLAVGTVVLTKLYAKLTAIIVKAIGRQFKGA